MCLIIILKILEKTPILIIFIVIKVTVLKIYYYKRKKEANQIYMKNKIHKNINSMGVLKKIKIITLKECLLLIIETIESIILKFIIHKIHLDMVGGIKIEEILKIIIVVNCLLLKIHCIIT